MKCPNCQQDLVMSERSGVEIDYCPQCRGVWLDRGELDKIIDRSTGSAMQSYDSPRSSGRPSDFPPSSKSDHKSKKRESWLGELFDFG